MPGTKVGGDLSSIPGDYMVKKRIDAHKLCPHLYVFNICAHRYVYTDTLNKQIKCEKKFRKKKEGILIYLPARKETHWKRGNLVYI